MSNQNAELTNFVRWWDEAYEGHRFADNRMLALMALRGGYLPKIASKRWNEVNRARDRDGRNKGSSQSAPVV
jgi:hypothetical protein